MNPVKSIVAATLLSTAALTTALHADPVAVAGMDRAVLQASYADASSAEKEVQLAYLGSQPAVWNKNRSRTIEATVDFFLNGKAQSMVLTVGPGQKVPYKMPGTSGAGSRIVGARYVN